MQSWPRGMSEPMYRLSKTKAFLAISERICNILRFPWAVAGMIALLVAKMVGPASAGWTQISLCLSKNVMRKFDTPDSKKAKV